MKINIDGHAIQVEGRPTLLEVARHNGIPIPSLCDHPELRPFTGCRLCLVEIKGRKDYAPSCGTYPEEGMEVKTETPELRGLRKGILELILSEHPYACLICEEKSNCEETKSTIRKVGEVTGCVLCPQNSRCDLQQAVSDLGIKKVSYKALYKNLDVRREDPFFDRDSNTCILCGKCIRVCEEVRGASVLAFISRGSQTVVGTALDRSLLDSGCQFCGACVDICPTASLVERAVRPQILPERFYPMICPFCSQGCELEMGTGQNHALFSRPSESGAVNRGQACVRGRFLVRESLDSPKRIRNPWIRKEGTLVPADWEEALEWTASRLKDHGNGRTGLSFSRQLPLEDAYLILKFAREGLNTDLVATSAATPVWTGLAGLMKKHDIDFSLNYRFDEISSADTILVLGADLPSAHPMAWLRIIKALDRGATLIFAGSGNQTAVRRASAFLKTRPGAEHLLATALSREIIRRGLESREIPGLKEFQETARDSEKSGTDAREIETAVDLFDKGKSRVVLFDQNLTRGSLGSLNLAAIWNLSLLTGARLIPLGSASNDRGISELERAHFSGQNSPSLDSLQGKIRDKEISALYLAGAVLNPGAERPEFLVCQDTHWSPMVESADIVLPAAAFAEVDGTFVNTEGRIQSSRASLVPPGGAKPDREIIGSMARIMGIAGFEFKDSGGILQEIATRAPALRAAGLKDGIPPGPAFVLESPSRPKKLIPMDLPVAQPDRKKKFPFLLSVKISGDVSRNFDMAREVRSLGRLRTPGWIFLHPADMKKIGLEEGDEIVVLASSGRLEGTARRTGTLSEGTAETTLSGSEPKAGEFLSRGIVPVEIRRRR